MTERKKGEVISLSDRAKLNRGKTPWRCGPHCLTKKAIDSFKANHIKIDLRKPKK